MNSSAFEDIAHVVSLADTRRDFFPGVFKMIRKIACAVACSLTLVSTAFAADSYPRTGAVLIGGSQNYWDASYQAAMAKLHSRLGVGLSGRLPYFEVLLEKPPTAQKFEVIAHRIIRPNPTQ